MGIATKIILIPCVVTEIGLLTKKAFSVMAALICILGDCIIQILKEHTSEVWK